MSNHILFSTNFDLCADEVGLRELPSGTTPHNPNQTRFIRRNAEIKGPKISAELSAQVAALAKAGDAPGLHALLQRELTPLGRATEGCWQ
jgi:hypothetical protein